MWMVCWVGKVRIHKMGSLYFSIQVFLWTCVTNIFGINNIDH